MTEHSIVCLRADVPSGFDDNVYRHCDACGLRIQLRPYAVRPGQRYVCWQCFRRETRGQVDVPVMVSPETIEELHRYFSTRPEPKTRKPN